jgi:hypothetical protein
VLAVWCALNHVGRDLSNIAFRTSVDLGNLGGKADGSVSHPTLKTDKNKPQRIAGPKPADEQGIPIPDSVDRIVILGDSTSDRPTTECVIARAVTRWSRPGRDIRVAWAPPGVDFDDLLRGTA